MQTCSDSTTDEEQHTGSSELSYSWMETIIPSVVLLCENFDSLLEGQRWFLGLLKKSFSKQGVLHNENETE